MGPFLAILGRGRHSRGSADPVGSTWCEYRAKRRHGDPFHTIFDVFGPRIGVPGPARTPLGPPMGLPEPITFIFFMTLKSSGAPRGSQSRFFEDAPSEIIGQEFSRGFRGSRGSPGNGVRSCSSDPPFHAQGSQDDVSSQANSLKIQYYSQ